MPDVANGPIRAQKGVVDYVEFREVFSIPNGAYTPGGYLLTMKDARKLEHVKVNCRGTVGTISSPAVTFSAHGEPVTNVSPNQIRVKLYFNSGAGLFQEVTSDYRTFNVDIEVIAWGY